MGVYIIPCLLCGADGCLDKASHADEHVGAPILNERLQVDFSRVNASGDGFSDSQDPYDGYEDRGPGQPHPDFTGGLVPRSGATEGRHGHRCQRVTVKPRCASYMPAMIHKYAGYSYAEGIVLQRQINSGMCKQASKSFCA